MPALQQKPRFRSPRVPAVEISPAEAALYMGDLLENLRKMADAQGLGVLSHLLELAQAETRMIVRDQKRARASHLAG